jgi:hypothetical protein
MNWQLLLVPENVSPCLCSMQSLAVIRYLVFVVKASISRGLLETCFPAVTEAFVDVTAVETEIYKATLCVVERFVIATYDRTGDCTALDAARKHLFTKKFRSLESLPPTDQYKFILAACQSAILQTVHCWLHAVETQPAQLNSSQWGWYKNDDRRVPLLDNYSLGDTIL